MALHGFCSSVVAKKIVPNSVTPQSWAPSIPLPLLIETVTFGESM
jgi:hypothetical protein